MNEWSSNIERWFWEHKLRFVSIDVDAMKRYAQEIAFQDFSLPCWRMPGIQPVDDADFPLYLLLVTAINAHYTHAHKPYQKYERYIPALRKTETGSMALGARFTELCSEPKGLSLDRMVPVLKSLRQTKKFFNRRALHHLPLIRERWYALREVIDILDTEFYGDARNIFEKARWDAWELSKILVHEFSYVFGKDFYSLEGESLMFAKKAQLFPMLYNGRAQSSNGRLKNLSSIERIGPICDYQLPRALEYLQIISYGPVLKSLIENSNPLEYGSQKEIEIRVATSVAFSHLLKEINLLRLERGFSPIHGGHLDGHLFFMGRRASTKHHITQTLAY